MISEKLYEIYDKKMESENDDLTSHKYGKCIAEILEATYH
jgi:hypothetical protein